jgi:hypothetical protein
MKKRALVRFFLSFPQNQPGFGESCVDNKIISMEQTGDSGASAGPSVYRDFYLY